MLVAVSMVAVRLAVLLAVLLAILLAVLLAVMIAVLIAVLIAVRHNQAMHTQTPKPPCIRCSVGASYIRHDGGCRAHTGKPNGWVASSWDSPCQHCNHNMPPSVDS